MVEILIVVLVYVVFFTTDGSRISRRDRNDPSGEFLLSETRPTRVIAISSKDESFRRRVLRGISSL